MRVRLPIRLGLRRSRHAVLMACALLAAAAGAQPVAPLAPRAVQDPHYGDGLFQFFQDQHFGAITSLMVSQHFNRLPVHADEAELLRGGMLLSYGLHEEAGRIFTRLIDATTMPVVRDRAWYYVGKIRYQRGFTFEAEEALGRVGSQLPPDLEDDRRLMQASLLAARDDHLGAAVVLGTIAGQSAAGRYARFNLGVALVKAGQAKEGMGSARRRRPVADAAARGRRCLGRGCDRGSSSRCATRPTSRSVMPRCASANPPTHAPTSTACGCPACSRTRRCWPTAGPPTS